MTSTPIIGIGAQVAGTTPAGNGAQASSGPYTRPGFVASRAIDTVSRDYDADDDADGAPYAAITSTEQRVLLALGTVPGSVAIDKTFGNRALLLRKDDGNLARSVSDACRDALDALAKEGAVSFDGATIETSPRGTLAFTAHWTDLATGEARSTSSSR